jgi:hypothetical protein
VLNGNPVPLMTKEIAATFQHEHGNPMGSTPCGAKEEEITRRYYRSRSVS